MRLRDRGSIGKGRSSALIYLNIEVIFCRLPPLWFRTSVINAVIMKRPQQHCHPERVKMILENTDSTEHNSIDSCRVGTVQGNCAISVDLAATGPLGMRSRVRRPFFRR